MLKPVACLLTLALAMLPVEPALAESGSAEGAPEAAPIRVELNKLEPREGACRAYFVFTNATDQRLQDYKLDLVLFDPDGVIAQRMAIDAGPLPAGKTRVKPFDLSGLACGEIERVLLNDVLACRTPDGPLPRCGPRSTPASRAAASFIK
ncbi:hypothetical protein [Rhodovibrio salinarum]|uniref:Tat pathway signal sequence domain protein n=1 Tax=Rhodovibrio salinarum TaxID=1087 RepID=A0A934QJ41_9PROT|nr:hypothetical protein [Rhodovibrio salinarum]MBK1697777.1 hypothetical protein [Rhodovibrio salinarum]